MSAEVHFKPSNHTKLVHNLPWFVREFWFAFVSNVFLVHHNAHPYYNLFVFDQAFQAHKPKPCLQIFSRSVRLMIIWHCKLLLVYSSLCACFSNLLLSAGLKPDRFLLKANISKSSAKLTENLWPTISDKKSSAKSFNWLETGWLFLPYDVEYIYPPNAGFLTILMLALHQKKD